MFGEWSFWGMHALWWLFWILVIFLAVVAFTSGSERIVRRRETPLELLQRRYAAGEIGEKEYEERKATLERDAHLVK
jgi:putative membrane protein